MDVSVKRLEIFIHTLYIKILIFTEKTAEHMTEHGIIFDIKKYSLHDGPGIRTTVFFKGCPLACWWCHNPESQMEKPYPVEYTGKRRDFYTAGNGTPPELGRSMSVAEVIEEIEKDRLFYDQSGGGVTFSGGEPLLQPRFLRALLEECKKRELHTVLDTTGYAEKKIVKAVLPLTDLFLYDLKLIDETAHTRYTGVSNGPVLENLQFLAREGAKIIIRIPVIPGITDSDANLRGIADFISGVEGVREINLLPYNQFGDHKYRRLHLDNPMPETVPPSNDEMNRIAEYFTGQGFFCQVGG